MLILLLDNYDSFTYNLVHYLEMNEGVQVEVHRNDQIDLEEINRFDRIVISPGPGLPYQAGITMQMLKRYYNTKVILGVCLGHQAIGEFFGASLVNLNKVFHGVASCIKIINKDPIYESLPSNFNVGRYHSWTLTTKALPKELIVTSVDNENNIMSIRHKDWNICSVQFHPESILTEYGKQIIENWIKS